MPCSLLRTPIIEFRLSFDPRKTTAQTSLAANKTGGSGRSTMAMLGGERSTALQRCLGEEPMRTRTTACIAGRRLYRIVSVDRWRQFVLPATADWLRVGLPIGGAIAGRQASPASNPHDTIGSPPPSPARRRPPASAGRLSPSRIAAVSADPS